MKLKIGILTFPFCANYGSVFLTYAIQRALSDMGTESFVLYYDNTFVTIQQAKDRIKDPRYGMAYIVRKIGKIGKNKIVDLLSAGRSNQIVQRAKCNEFAKKHIRATTIKLKTICDLEKELRNYDIALIGGDQVWNVCGEEWAKVYFLNFKLPHGVRKVSYAPCFGGPEVPAKLKGLVGDSLRDFDSIGVRNEMSQEVVKRLSGRDATVVVDPTLLISFDEITSKTNLGIGMIAFYCIKISQSCMWAIKHRLKKPLGCNVLSISLFQQFLLADKWARGVGPSEWLGIFKNAEYIVTDSFHGTIFAIKNRKQFITIASKKYDTAYMRMVNILQRYGLEDRLVTSSEEVSAELMLRPIDYDRVHADIARDVEASYEYLKTALAPAERSSE